uniref:NPC intracellular cholesterol transporter 2 n=1 Tax=Salmo salar TaxID=8030 RepID=B5XBW0_SALSA|nr:Ecdysteroid-regulated 16 kDa protein precursor [Salmo salar]ACI68330.1 Ecdysteroid-regulated 16 kDa protein precursor [Salmo salar]
MFLLGDFEMRFSVFFLVCLLVVETIFCTDFKPCEEHSSNGIQSLNIEGCENFTQCIFYANKDAVISTVFNVRTKYDDVMVGVYYKLGFTWFPVPGFPRPACVNDELSCPLEPNTTYNYTTKSLIPSYTPRINLDIKFELMDKSTLKSIVCAVVNVKIV